MSSWGMNMDLMSKKEKQKGLFLFERNPLYSASHLATFLTILFFLVPNLHPFFTPVVFHHWNPLECIRICKVNIHISVVAVFGSPQLREHLRPAGHDNRAARSSSQKNAVWHIKVFALCRMIIAILFLSFIYSDWFSIIKWAAVGGERGIWLCTPGVCIKSIFTFGTVKRETRSCGSEAKQ